MSPEFDNLNNPEIKNEKPFYKENWNDLSDEEKTNVIERYGDPIILANKRIEIGDGQRAGTCPANETSLASIRKDPMYWGRYSPAVVNDSMLVYGLEMSPRFHTSKIIVGENGGMIVPGMIYTESSLQRDGEKSLGKEIYSKGTWQGDPQKERGTFVTFRFDDSEENFRLTPLRRVAEGNVGGRLNVTIDGNTVKEIVNEMSARATEKDPESYKALHDNITYYFDEPENPELLKRVKLNSVLSPGGQIHEVWDNDFDTSIYFRPGEEFQAIKDPIAWNNMGQEVYILKNEDEYYFCPSENCEVVE